MIINNIGVNYVIDNQLNDLNPAVVIGEGPPGLKGIFEVDTSLALFGVSVAHKRPFWLKLELELPTSGHGSVTIGSIEKHITDVAWEKGWIDKINVINEKEESVGIIGSGPAGLAAGEELRKKGYQVTIYDRYDRPGGLLIYGIPNFKLEKEIVIRRTNRLSESGINFEMKCEIGSSASFEQ